MTGRYALNLPHSRVEWLEIIGPSEKHPGLWYCRNNYGQHCHVAGSYFERLERIA